MPGTAALRAASEPVSRWAVSRGPPVRYFPPPEEFLPDDHPSLDAKSANNRSSSAWHPGCTLGTPRLAWGATEVSHRRGTTMRIRVLAAMLLALSGTPALAGDLSEFVQ